MPHIDAAYLLFEITVDSLRSPFGPACGCYSASLRFALTAANFWQSPGRPAPPKVSKRSCPMHPSRLRRLDSLRCVSSLHHCSVGTLRRAILGPTQLSRHPAAQPTAKRLRSACLKGRLSVRGWMGLAREGGGLFAALLSPPYVCISVLVFDLAKPCCLNKWPNDSVQRSRQEAEWRCCVEGRLAGCQTRHVGPRMARLADPRSSAGARGVERSETRMSGALSLWLLSLLREQRESNSPRGETSK
jgi:hypothetical protein